MVKCYIKKLNIGDFIALDYAYTEWGKAQLKAMREYCKRHNLEVRLTEIPFYHKYPELGNQKVWMVFEKGAEE